MRWSEKIRNRKKNCSGETIVEVLVSAMIFLLLMAVLQGAITFCSSAQKKSSKIRKNNAEMLKAIESTPITGNGTGTYEFYAYDIEEANRGNKVFSVNADLGRKDVSYEDTDGNTRTVHFYLFDGGGP